MAVPATVSNFSRFTQLKWVSTIVMYTADIRAPIGGQEQLSQFSDRRDRLGGALQAENRGPFTQVIVLTLPVAAGVSE
jgi:hypothetical protein